MSIHNCCSFSNPHLVSPPQCLGSSAFYLYILFCSMLAVSITFLWIWLPYGLHYYRDRYWSMLILSWRGLFGILVILIGFGKGFFYRCFLIGCIRFVFNFAGCFSCEILIRRIGLGVCLRWSQVDWFWKGCMIYENFKTFCWWCSMELRARKITNFVDLFILMGFLGSYSK